MPRVRAALEKHTALEWEVIFGEKVPCGAVRPIEDMFDHPQVLEQGYVAHLSHPTAGDYRAFSGAFQFGAVEKPETFSAPAKGEHTRAILETNGFTAREIDRLLQDGAVEDH